MYAFEKVLQTAQEEIRGLLPTEPEVQLSDDIDFDNISFEPRSLTDKMEEQATDTIDFESSGPIAMGVDARREPGIWPAPEPEEKSWVGRAWEGVLKSVRDDEAEKVKSANATAMAESLGISPSEAYDNLDILSKEVGLRGQPTFQELIGGMALGGVTVGLLANPLTTIIGVGTFMGLAEVENALVSLRTDIGYEPGTMKGFQELLPEDTGQGIKDLVWTADMAWKAVLGGGIGRVVTPKLHGGLQSLYTKFVRDVSARYNLPKDVYISPGKIREFHGRGREEVISRAETDMLKDLGLTRQQYVDALKQGIDVRIPAEKIITAVDKPWWAMFKRMIGARPYKMEFGKRGEPTIKAHTELLSPPLRGIPKRPVKPIDAVPEYEFVSKKGHVYEKIGDKWYGSKGREISNKFVIKAAEEGKSLVGEVTKGIEVEDKGKVIDFKEKVGEKLHKMLMDRAVSSIEYLKALEESELALLRPDIEIEFISRSRDKGTATYKVLSGRNEGKTFETIGPVIIPKDKTVRELSLGDVDIKPIIRDYDAAFKRPDLKIVEVPPEESQFRQEPEITKGNLELLPDYKKIDTPEQLLARITNEINSELDGKFDAGLARQLLTDLSNKAKLWATGEESPGGIFEGMLTNELSDVSEYLDRMDGWAKQTDRSKIEPTGGPLVVSSDRVGDIIYLSFDAVGKVPTVEELKAIIKETGAKAEISKFKTDLISGTRGIVKFRLDIVDPKTGVSSTDAAIKLYRDIVGQEEPISGRSTFEELIPLESRFRKALDIKVGTEPSVTLGMGVPIQDLFDKLTMPKKAKVRLPEVPPKPYTGVKEEAREIVMERRARLDTLNYKVNKFVNELEYGYSEKQLEAAYFAIEKTKVPEKLNRPDLKKVLSKDKKILDDIAKQTKYFHDKQWTEIKKVWPDLTTKQIEDYITHLYDIPKHKRAEAANWFSTFAKSLEPRLIPTMEMAIEKGFIPKTLNVAEIIKINSGIINRAIANVEYVKALLALKKDGLSLIERSKKAPMDWIEVNYPALTRRIPLKKGEAKRKGEFVKESRVRVHPDLVRPLKVIFEERFDHPMISAYEAINGILKKGKLTLQLFHHGALGETGIALMGILKTVARVYNPVKIYKALVHGELDIFTKEPLAMASIEDGVQYGATADIPVQRIQGYLNDLARVSRDVPLANKITWFLKGANSTWDKALWTCIHDPFKLYGYEMLVGRMDPNLDAVSAKKKRREIARLVNDTFGGQNWDNLMMTPKEVQMMTWTLLSADWTMSTTRQALAPTGIGSVYKETKGLRRKMGLRFWARAGLYFGIGMNLLNVLARNKDIEENPQYYEDKDYSFFDKTMFGNTMGKKTYLFNGRYEDGTERYIRWGKQFRDFFELFVNPIKKIGGKAAPIPQLVSELATGHTLSGFKNDDIYGADGLEYTMGIFKTIAKAPLPISILRYMREDMEFKPLDIMMQSSKGMSRYSSTEYFKKAIVEGDEEALRDTYVSTLRNNLPAYTLFTRALYWAEAEATASLAETVKSIEDAKIGLYTAETTNEKKRYGKMVSRLNKEKADKSMGLKLFKAVAERAKAYRNMELGGGTSRLP